MVFALICVLLCAPHIRVTLCDTQIKTKIDWMLGNGKCGRSFLRLTYFLCHTWIETNRKTYKRKFSSFFRHGFYGVFKWVLLKRTENHKVEFEKSKIVLS